MKMIQFLGIVLSILCDPPGPLALWQQQNNDSLARDSTAAQSALHATTGWAHPNPVVPTHGGEQWRLSDKPDLSAAFRLSLAGGTLRLTKRRREDSRTPDPRLPDEHLNQRPAKAANDAQWHRKWNGIDGDHGAGVQGVTASARRVGLTVAPQQAATGISNARDIDRHGLRQRDDARRSDARTDHRDSSVAHPPTVTGSTIISALRSTVTVQRRWLAESRHTTPLRWQAAMSGGAPLAAPALHGTRLEAPLFAAPAGSQAEGGAPLSGSLWDLLPEPRRQLRMRGEAQRGLERYGARLAWAQGPAGRLRESRRVWGMAPSTQVRRLACLFEKRTGSFKAQLVFPAL